MSDEKSFRIQVLRGLAILAVIIIHTTPAGLPQVFIRPFVNFSVGFFLFLSGMLSDASKWHPKKRLLKVLIPYVIWTVIFVLLSSHSDPVSFAKRLARGLITADSASIMYYIFVYCQLTLLIPLIDKLASSKLRFAGMLISPLEIIIMRLIPKLIGIQFSGIVSTIMSVSCLGWFSYFYLGYLMHKNSAGVSEGKRLHSDERAKKAAPISTGILAAGYGVSVLFQMAEGWVYYSLGDENCGTQLKLSALLTGLLFCLLAARYIDSGKPSKLALLKITGDVSFGMYFSHILIINLLTKISYYNDWVIFPLNFVVVAGITLGISLLMHKLPRRIAGYLAF